MKLDDARDFWRRRGVPDEAIEDLWTISETARYNDAEAEEHDLEKLLLRWGWHPQAVNYLAQQRALRVLAVATPDGRNALREFARKFQAAQLQGIPEEALIPLQMSWIDGFANGVRSEGRRHHTGLEPDVDDEGGDDGE